jgi:hypothetical protein
MAAAVEKYVTITEQEIKRMANKAGAKIVRSDFYPAMERELNNIARRATRKATTSMTCDTGRKTLWPEDMAAGTPHGVIGLTVLRAYRKRKAAAITAAHKPANKKNKEDDTDAKKNTKEDASESEKDSDDEQEE